jgi:hypothetical protein
MSEILTGKVDALTMRQAMADFDMGTLFGIPVRCTPFPLEREVPVREHKKRRTQSASYHKRVQKKWVKRWGMKKERYALMFNPAALGMSGQPTMFLNPREMVMLRNFSD